MDPSIRPYFLDPNRIQREVDAVLRMFSTFVCKSYVTPQPFVELTGMISTVYQKNLYMTPIRIVLTNTYPKSAPLCYLNPRASPTPMYIDRQCPNADCNTGLVRNVSYLINWQVSFDVQLPIVLEILQRHFSDPNPPPLRAAVQPPPLFDQPKVQQQQPQQRQQQQQQQQRQQQLPYAQMVYSNGATSSGVAQFNPPGGYISQTGVPIRNNGIGGQMSSSSSSSSSALPSSNSISPRPPLQREDSLSDQFRKQVSLALQEQMKNLTIRLATSIDSTLDELDSLESRRIAFENLKQAQALRLVELSAFQAEAEKRAQEAKTWLDKWEGKLKFNGDKTPPRHRKGSDVLDGATFSEQQPHPNGHAGEIHSKATQAETMVTATTVLRNQLLECTAGDAAIEDCYRYLHDLERNQIEALTSGTNTTSAAEALCAEVRLLAVKQFKLRALKRKIQTALENEAKMVGESLTF